MSAIREFVDIEAILEAQSAAGVDRVVLCSGGDMGPAQPEKAKGKR